MQALRRRDECLQRTVDADAHAKVRLVRLDVDVARAAIDRLGEQEVAQRVDRRRLAGDLQLLRDIRVLVVRLALGSTASTARSKNRPPWRISSLSDADSRCSCKKPVNSDSVQMLTTRRQPVWKRMSSIAVRS